ncbi:hypothetical protein TK11N_09350 [Tetragenococcus koreensis]|uniref:Uncharacterized protein n=1 Tax=Tetragenococcus koreensis TaxID=290335 RepID=A0AAN4RLN0_9ENTE|nr:hypothetical protein TKO01_10500 [Tetragenococcus koreensis]GEQ49083.1 hypothetical protein TK11N_09350 [Tetragenococcus koreensis]GEQ51577.1 hypothetical protein TK12N_09210 [Tetragenococcus koreensis]GEQ54135.1 hypothetical protein TK2N_09790 [Tetragenococcus koreensis]GEQ56579.1 hypothetical protein TK4N_09220 [Tetragenococcus koreensis]
MSSFITEFAGIFSNEFFRSNTAISFKFEKNTNDRFRVYTLLKWDHRICVRRQENDKK